jgi:hypothetical protein
LRQKRTFTSRRSDYLVLVDRDQGGCGTTEFSLVKKAAFMTTSDIEFLVLAVGALSLFGSVLAWASWMEARDDKRKRQAPAPTAIGSAEKSRPF